MRSATAIKYIIGATLWLSNPLWAQIIVKGSVRESGSGKPLEFVNVFLSGSTTGTTTNADGTFTFSVPQAGKYELVASFVGYESFKQLVNLQKDATFQFDIRLRQKVTELAGIVVLSDSSSRKKNLKEFKRLFIGETPNSAACKIINPSSIYVYLEDSTNVLFAHSTSPIIIENKAIGYRIYYSLERFEFDYNQQTISYLGTARFEDLAPKNDRIMDRWKRARARTYGGSIKHLLRCIQMNTLEENGWNVTLSPKQGFIHGKELMSSTNPNELKFRGKIHATYTKRFDPRPSVITKGQYSEIEFLVTPLILFDNGYYEPQTSVMLYGYLGWSQRIAELLPLGYELNH